MTQRAGTAVDIDLVGGQIQFAHCRHGDEARRDAMMNLAAMAFAEDKVMIEAQQQVIDQSPDARIMPTTHDRSVTLFNRLVKKLITQEGDNAVKQVA